MPYSSPAGLKLTLGLVIDGQSVAAGATFTIAYKGLLYAVMYQVGAGADPLAWSIQINSESTVWMRIAVAKVFGGFTFLGNGTLIRAYNEGVSAQSLTVLQLSPLDPVIETVDYAIGLNLLPVGLFTLSLHQYANFWLAWKLDTNHVTTSGISPNQDTALVESDGVNLYVYTGSARTGQRRLRYIP